MKYQWQFTTDEENPEGYFQKLVNMNTPEVLSLEEAAERLNELEDKRLTKKDLEMILSMLIKLSETCRSYEVANYSHSWDEHEKERAYFQDKLKKIKEQK